MKRPSFQFYPGDWLRATDLRACSVGARGLWIDMICLMHEGTPYGHLKVNSKVITQAHLSRMVGASLNEVEVWIKELEDTGVLSTSTDGVFFSRRMVKDEELRNLRAEGGKAGGNPKLTAGYNKPGFVYAMRRDTDNAVKIGISQEPAKRLYKIRAQFPDAVITLIGKCYVEDMGTEEARLHQLFLAKKSGDWFSLDDRDLATLLYVHLKAKTKDTSTPSSSSASASSTAVKIEDDDLGASTKTPFERVYDFGCSLFPQLVTQTTSAINQWIDGGADVDLDIIPEIKRLHGKGIQPRGWGLFTQDIANAKLRRETPLPKGELKNAQPRSKHTDFAAQDYRAGTDGFIVT
jgi:hypothetical protein